MRVGGGVDLGVVSNLVGTEEANLGTLTANEGEVGAEEDKGGGARVEGKFRVLLAFGEEGAEARVSEPSEALMSATRGQRMKKSAYL